MTLALVKRQVAVAEIKPGKRADKWKVFRDASEARETLKLQDRSLAVLDALLTFYPENELRSEASLVVFPSNVQLSLRAHGIAGATLRRHLALLVEAGLIVRKDSANGKRYARKDRSGEIDQAFGFDISPLLDRCEELALLAQQVAAERAKFRRARENLTICRRDVRKLISAAIEEGAPGDWQHVEDIYLDVVRRVPRNPGIRELESILSEMELLREEVVNRLDLQGKSAYHSSNDAHHERHIQNSNTESITELEPSSEEEQSVMLSSDIVRHTEPLKILPLSLVLRACPTIADYGPGGKIDSWRDLMSAAVVVRSMLGVSPSAYQSACETLGAEGAAATIACILERSAHINSAGGYLRNLSSKAARGEFSLGPMLMALARNGQTEGRKRA
jgi:replication initiation protein RepC